MPWTQPIFELSNGLKGSPNSRERISSASSDRLSNRAGKQCDQLKAKHPDKDGATLQFSSAGGN